MLVYIIKRLLLLPLLLLVFSIVAFILIQAPPGDFVTSYVAELASSGSSIDQQQIEALRNLYGLDQPYYVQYLKWISRILQGDLGVSLDWRKPISELIGQRLLLTAQDP
jgi:peptide/nickel transport system permease protein